MNELDIQNCLYQSLLRKARIACPNYTTPGWWEADLWAVTTSGYAVEYEIKCTRRDFKVDALKTGDRWAVRRANRTGQPLLTKHQRLDAHDPKGPSRFYFVTPKGLIKPEELPPWAGWIEISESYKRLYPKITTPAPQIHRQKVDPKVIDHCRSVFYYRYWNLRAKV